ncbi:conserved hypothetical protein [Paraburkholderia tropica]|nr:hypothetical protein [Paraburkholderia tropica]CAG9231746.1 conserved hypothetical protein [Paraburkholderia tropica]
MFFRSGSIRFPPASRVNGSGGSRDLDRVELDLARDRHARAAMEAYADSCEAELPWLSEALRQSRFGRSDKLTQCSSTVLRAFVLAQARAAAQPDYAHAAWEHVRVHLAALLAGEPPAAEERGGHSGHGDHSGSHNGHHGEHAHHGQPAQADAPSADDALMPSARRR